MINWEQNLLARFYKTEIFKVLFPELHKKGIPKSFVTFNKEKVAFYKLEEFGVNLSSTGCLLRKESDLNYRYCRLEEHMVFHSFTNYFAGVHKIADQLSFTNIDSLTKEPLLASLSKDNLYPLNRCFIAGIMCQEIFEQLTALQGDKCLLGEDPSLYGKFLIRCVAGQTLPNSPRERKHYRI